MDSFFGIHSDAINAEIKPGSAYISLIACFHVL